MLHPLGGGEYICTSDFCVESANRLLKHIDKDEIGALIFITQYPDSVATATGFRLQDRLGLSRDVFICDVTLGCSGFCYGIVMAKALLSLLNEKKVLLMCGDTQGRDLTERDIEFLPILGDAGCAAVISTKPKNKIYYNVENYGDMADYFINPVCDFRRYPILKRSQFDPLEVEITKMDGDKVMDFTLKQVPPNIKELMNYAKVTPDELDLVVLHQANKMITDSLADLIGVGLDKAPWESREIGNVSSASIPVCFSELKRKNELKSGKFLMSGFGVGMTVVSLIMDLDENCVLETGEL